MIFTNQIRADLIHAIDAALGQYAEFPVDPKFIVIEEDERASILRLQAIKHDLIATAGEAAFE